jgi:hypothetical protein
MPNYISWLHHVPTETLYFGSCLNSHSDIYYENGLSTHQDLVEIEWEPNWLKPEIRQNKQGQTERIQSFMEAKFPTWKDLETHIASLVENRLKNIPAEYLLDTLSHWPGITPEMQLTYLDKIPVDKLFTVMLRWNTISKDVRKSFLPKLKTQTQLVQIGTPGHLFSLEECRVKILPFLTNDAAYQAGLRFKKLTRSDKLALTINMNEKYILKAIQNFKNLTDQDRKNLASRILDPDLQENLKPIKENPNLPIYSVA